MERKKKRFRVTIEGETYEVEVEEVAEGTESGVTPPTTPDPAEVSPVSAKKPPTAVPGQVSSPMPGTVVSLRVRVGDMVKAGDVLLVLESMKVEIDIVAPREGVVKEVYVSENASVRTKDPLVLIE